MKMIELEDAKAAGREIDEIVRNLNTRMIEAGLAGLIIEASLLTIEQIGPTDQIQVLMVEVKVRPDQIIQKGTAIECSSNYLDPLVIAAAIQSTEKHR